MFKIGEFSRMTQVSVRMLRYYDEQGLLKPSQIDAVSGYRFYQASQMETLGKILSLRDMGFSIKEMKALLRDWQPEAVKEQLRGQLQKTQDQIRKEQEKLLQIQSYLADLEAPKTDQPIQILMKTLPAFKVLSIRRRMPNYYMESVLWKELGEKLQGLRGVDTSQSFSIYHDLDTREENVDIEVCVAMDGAYDRPDCGLVFRQVEAVERAACFMVYGPYSHISKAYQQFAYWLESHPHYQMSGPTRQICHVSACQTDRPEEYITELQIPLKSADLPG